MPCLLYMHMDGRGLFKVLFASFSNCPCCIPYVLLIAGYVTALESIDYPTFLSFGSCSLGIMMTCLIVVLPLKYVCILYLPHVFLKLSASLVCMIWLHIPCWNLVLKWLLVLCLHLDCCLLVCGCCCPQFVFVVPCCWWCRLYVVYCCWPSRTIKNPST